MSKSAQAGSSAGRTYIFYNVFTRGIEEISTPEDIAAGKRFTMRFSENHYTTKDLQIVERAVKSRYFGKTFWCVVRRIPVIPISGLIDETSVGRMIDQDVLIKAKIRAESSMVQEKMGQSEANNAVDTELTRVQHNRNASREKAPVTDKMREGKPETRITKSRSAMKKALEEQKTNAGATGGESSDSGTTQGKG